MKKVLGVVLCLLLITGCATSHLDNGSESVVEFDEGGISAQDLYEKLKKENGLNALTIMIDTELLAREYKEDDVEKEYIRQVIAGLKEDWKDEFDDKIKSYYGVSSESELRDYIQLTYRRNKWYDAYALSQVNDTQISDYEKDSLIGDMELSHILIESKASQNASTEEKEKAENEAKEKAQEIINRLNNGESFESLSKELNDDKAVKENGGYLGKDINDRSSYDKNFLDAAIKLEVGKYSSSPVKSKFGYHIIYKASQADKPSIDKVKDEVKNKIANDMRSADSNFNNNAIKALRDKYKIKITDSDLKKSYEDIFGE
ncbi:MAG: hypothetical protein HFE04_01850 [Bacilli bacterium]|nr:hypothetical protein [Bacilli bacterium]